MMGPTSWSLWLFFSTAALFVARQVTALSQKAAGTTVYLDDVAFFVSPSPASTFDYGDDNDLKNLVHKVGGDFADGLIPFSVISTNSSKFDDDALSQTLEEFKARDDVWSASFLSGLYISYTGSSGRPSTSLTSAQNQFGVQFVIKDSHYSAGTTTSEPLPQGPYFLDSNSGNIFQAFRLYNDEQQSFVYGTIPDANGGFQALSAHINGAATQTIAVPSRLYFTPTPDRPLAGKRVAVKDIYDIQGLHTGCGNRAFFNLYPPKNTTAPAIQRLLDGGAILVGKTKTSQFANGETATDDWVDLHAPYNPRGDGYQDGSSSSTGSGTAIAAYDWLDFAVGTDTGGSMRGPAGVNGVFGNRPSHGAIALDNVMPLSPEFDTAGIFARDAKEWAVAGNWWYQNFQSFPKFPSKLLFPVDGFGSSYLATPPQPGTADAIFNDFISKLEQFLNTKRTEIMLTQLWSTTKPSDSAPSNIQDLLLTTYVDLITLDQIQLVADPFINDYKAAHDGRMPFINPTPLARWGYGRSLPPSRKDEALTNKTIFMDWFGKEIVQSGNPDTCSESILIYPQSNGTTNYRNKYASPSPTPFGFFPARAAVYAETPDLVVPIGELPYNSTITGLTEYLPVTLSFVAAKGCDLMLFNLFAALQDAGIVAPVKTGSRLT